jgi:hypothetical protein
MPRLSHLIVLAWFIGFAAALPVAAAAQDVVHLSGSQGRQRIVGKVIDYTGKELTLTTAAGLKTTLPADRVQRIETQRTVEHVEADKLFAGGDYAAAAAGYEQAQQRDSRNWVRRQITAQIVWCRQYLGETARAVEEFLSLVESDPDTPHFGCIPLAWIAAEPSI